MKKFLLAIISGTIMMMSTSVSAQNDYGYFNSLAAGLNVGSSGIGVNLASPIGNHFDLRVGALFMPGIKISTDVDVDIPYNLPEGSSGSYPTTIQVNGDLGRVSGEILLNYYPFRSTAFFITAGAAFAGDKLIKIDGHNDELRDLVSELGGDKVGINIGDYVLPVDKNGNVFGGLKVSPFRPYLGLGFGHAVPRNRLGFMVELGVQFHGTPDVYTSSGILETSKVADPDDTFTKVIDKLKVYPVLKFTLTGRIF